MNYAGNAQAAKEVVSEIEKTGSKAIAVQADVSLVPDVTRLFDAAIEQFGKLDILVNNAGLILYKLLADTSEEEFDRLFAVNVKGTFFACQQAAKRMADDGRIINFSSSTTAMMLATYSAYVATKGGGRATDARPGQGARLSRDHRQLRLAGRDRHRTIQQGQDRGAKEKLRPDGGIGRIGKPEEVADVVAMLVSNDARWVTGQNLRANGGTI